MTWSRPPVPLSRCLVVSLFALLPACSKPYIRPYQWTTQQAALQTLARRAESVTSVQAPCTLTLTDAHGESVNFDGALAVRAHDDQVWLRLRTWKVGQAVFDLTVKPEGVWLMTSDQAAARMTGPSPLQPEHIAQAWSLYMGRFFSDPGANIIDAGGPTFTVHRTLDNTAITATIDRETLTVRDYTITTPDTGARQTLTLSLYREIGEHAIPFPRILRAQGPQGTIEVRMEDIDLNAPIDDAAFNPPRRALKQ